MKTFNEWINVQDLSPSNINKVLSIVDDLSKGKSLVAVTGITGETRVIYDKFIDKTITPDMINQHIIDEVGAWAPRGKKCDVSKPIRDASNGWATTHPLSKMRQYHEQITLPTQEYSESQKKSKQIRANMIEFNMDKIKSRKRDREWYRKSHIATNAEETGATIPFLEACCKYVTKHGMENWAFCTEHTFDNAQRADVYIKADQFHIIVESKTTNLLHGIGQVLHYHQLAMKDIEGYENTNSMKLVVLSKAPRPLELETAAFYGVKVWWPNSQSLPFQSLLNTMASESTNTEPSSD